MSTMLKRAVVPNPWIPMLSKVPFSIPPFANLSRKSIKVNYSWRYCITWQSIFSSSYLILKFTSSYNTPGRICVNWFHKKIHLALWPLNQYLSIFSRYYLYQHLIDLGTDLEFSSNHTTRTIYSLNKMRENKKFCTISRKFDSLLTPLHHLNSWRMPHNMIKQLFPYCFISWLHFSIYVVYIVRQPEFRYVNFTLEMFSQ